MAQVRKYTPGEEFANAFSHSIGALLSVYGIVMLAVNSHTPIQAASTAIFGTMMFILFQSSACYHAMTNETAKKVFQKIDHSAIFLLIGGTYTPLLLLLVPFPTSVALLAMIWYLCIIGIVFSCLTLKFKSLSTGLYLLLGWLSGFLFYSMWTSTCPEAVWYMLAGGVFYSLGCIFYMMKQKYMHSIWHLFVIAGAALHYVCILQILKAGA